MRQGYKVNTVVVKRNGLCHSFFVYGREQFMENQINQCDIHTPSGEIVAENFSEIIRLMDIVHEDTIISLTFNGGEENVDL